MWTSRAEKWQDLFPKKNQYKHVDDNFPAQHFQKAFQIGLWQSKRCFSSREGSFSSQTSKLHSNFEINMQTFAPGFSDQKF